jgi:hypothetical protein
MYPWYFNSLQRCILFYGFCVVLAVNSDHSLKQLVCVMVKYGVLFEVRTELLNNT